MKSWRVKGVETKRGGALSGADDTTFQKGGRCSPTIVQFFKKMYYRSPTTVFFFVLEAIVAVRQRSFLKICAVVLLRRYSFLKSGEVEKTIAMLLHCSTSTFYPVRVRILAEVQRDGIFTGGGNDDFGAVVHELVAEIHS